jgi:hypothetical protein
MCLARKSTCAFPPTVFHYTHTGYEVQRLSDKGLSISCIILGQDGYGDRNKRKWRKDTQKAVLWIQIRINRIHMFLGLPDPDPLVRGMDPDPDPALDPDPSIIMQK